MRTKLLIAGLLTLAVLVLAPSALADGGGLEFLGTDSLSASLGGESSEPFNVWLKNTGSGEAEPSFEAALVTGDGGAVTPGIEVVEGKSVAGDGVARFRLKLTDASSSSGQLVAKAAGLSPASTSITLAPKLDLGRGVNGALIFPFLAAALLVGLSLIYSGVGIKGLRGPLGSAQLEFSSNFAGALTAVGALLGTIISAGVLPAETVNLSKAGFTGLNLTFGVAIVVAAIVYAGLQRVVPQKGSDAEEATWELEGYVYAFLAAALITVWAAFGELWTLWRLAEELGREEGFSTLAVLVFKGLLILAGSAMVVYTPARIKTAICKPPSENETATKPRGSRPRVGERRRRVTLL
jgi:hypothetical protein